LTACAALSAGSTAPNRGSRRLCLARRERLDASFLELLDEPSGGLLVGLGIVVDARSLTEIDAVASRVKAE
jgi:hypothetical protein